MYSLYIKGWCWCVFMSTIITSRSCMTLCFLCYLYSTFKSYSYFSDRSTLLAPWLKARQRELISTAVGDLSSTVERISWMNHQHWSLTGLNFNFKRFKCSCNTRHTCPLFEKLLPFKDTGAQFFFYKGERFTFQLHIHRQWMKTGIFELTPHF